MYPQREGLGSQRLHRWTPAGEHGLLYSAAVGRRSETLVPESGVLTGSQNLMEPGDSGTDTGMYSGRYTHIHGLSSNPTQSDSNQSQIP